MAAALAALALAAVSPSAASDLDGDARRRLERGDTVVERRPVEGFPWPEVVAWRRVAAPPIAVLAVYADFDGQARYMPQIVASRVVGRDGATAFRVFYEYEVPGPNETYTVAMSLHRAGDAMEARWSLLKARYARRLAGELRAIPHEGGTLVRYTSRVDPGLLGATFGDPDSVARRLQATLEALAARVQRLAAEEPDRLRELVRALSALLG
jgi:hypothetical protein